MKFLVVSIHQKIKQEVFKMAEENVNATPTPPEVKPGWKTTEFWTSVASAVVGVLFLSGTFTQQEAQGISLAISNISGSLMVICPAIAYAISRGKAKENPMNLEAILNLLGGVVQTPPTQTTKKR